MEHFLVVEVHFEVGREAQFVCQVFQDRLEERVDGFHTETVIIVQDMAEGRAGTAADFFLRQLDTVRPEFFLERFQIIGGGWKSFPNAIKLLEDTVFHFGRSLIGESDG